MIKFLRPVSQATICIICFPRIAVVPYMNVNIHRICLIMKYDTVLFKTSFIVRFLYKFVTRN